MSYLNKYKQKRDFSKTPEPKGNKSEKKENVFVVQKHDASNLHYDFRLEIGGLLKSWVIPKGPSLDPGIKRLAIPTEDHPLSYAEFEGVIPRGEYGGGIVMVWDIGEFNNIKNTSLKQAFNSGKLEIELKGKKLKGKFALINTKTSKNWLFFKIKDKFAKKGQDILKLKPNSALTGRSLKQIAQS
jgi:bifunctional non-homologous end joining protein LigD